ncbi:MAG: peptidoglycan-binding protein [Desulforhopalus sp.]|nr:peptidoglycan-binding protein [Desulforhopalus sp.]
MRHGYLCLSFILLFSTTLLGCSSNIHHIDTNISCPVEFTFNAPFEKTWLASLAAVKSFATVNNLNKEVGLISTNIATVDGNNEHSRQQSFWDETYTFSFTIIMSPENGDSATHVETKVQLYRQQFVMASRTGARVESVENYLREMLYKEICKNLFPDGNGHCSSRFNIQPVVTTPLKSESPPPEPPAPKPKPKFDAKLQAAQKALIEAGYTPGPADGFMGKKTREALKTFQEDNNLTINGKLDKTTYEFLISQNTAGTPRLEPKLTQDLLPKTQPKATNTEASLVIQDRPLLTPSPSAAPTGSVVTATEKKPSGNFVTKDIAYLLKSADVYGSEIMDSIPAKTALHVVSRSGEYYQVKYKGKEGYIYSDSVSEQ